MKAIVVLTISLWALIIAGLVLPAHAAPQCGKRAFIVAQLATKYSETRRGMGLGPNNTLMELFASDATGTWTITVTTAVDGMTCLMASGGAFEQVTEALPPAGVPG